MRYVGITVVIALLVGAGLYFGGYFNGDVDVQLTAKGRQTYNQGVDAVQEGVGKLRASENTTPVKGK